MSKNQTNFNAMVSENGFCNIGFYSAKNKNWAPFTALSAEANTENGPRLITIK